MIDTKGSLEELKPLRKIVVRYASAARGQEPQLAEYKPSAEGVPCACPQNKFRLDFITGSAEPLPQTEDCHFLTICSPAENGERLPVVVWLHGGAYIAGSGCESTYDATTLAQEGHIVVVTVSYRLGAFGYLHDEANGMSNLGLKDQLMALRWVQRYIDTFGGDPARVTIAGQSAGGHSVASLIAHTQEPLFTQAIIQSAPVGMQTDSREAERIWRDFSALLGKSFVSATTEEILAAQAQYMAQSRSMMPFSPLNPRYMELAPNPALRRVRIMYQHDDAAPFVAMALHHQSGFGNIFDRLATRVATAKTFAQPAMRYAHHLQQAGVNASVQSLNIRPAGSPFGACHCLEVAWLFGSWQRWQNAPMTGAMTQSEWQLQSRLFRRQWTDFVKGL